MKVILTADVPRVGYQGDLLDVKDGYARNYLIPQGYAQPATKGNLKQFEHLRLARTNREDHLRDEAKKTVARLAGAPIALSARAGETGRLYGSITSGDIAKAIERTHHLFVDRRKIELKAPIRVLGEHKVRIALYPDIATEVTVVVTSDVTAPVIEAVAGYDPTKGEVTEPTEVASEQAFEVQSEPSGDDDGSEASNGEMAA